MNNLLLPILIPLFSGLLVLCLGQGLRKIREGIAVMAAAANLIIAILLFKKEAVFNVPWVGFGIDFSLRQYHFSAFILLAAAFFAFLIILYSLPFMRERKSSRLFLSYSLISLSLINGAVLADNLVLLLFFWEGLLALLFGLIAIGGKNSFKTATKAFVIIGISDLCMMIGIGITGYLAQTLTISKINLSFGSLESLAFVLLMIGAISKAGSMPFHTWIPDAASDAPLPFMAFFPAALEKLLGIYFLTRITLDMFKLSSGSWISVMLMVIGAITILFAVMMALIQKNFKKLLSYHAISQVGYMILGVGTALPVGIIGGLFHMLNNALYKSCLFLTAGAVEKQTGTTDLEKLGGLSKKMPLTFTAFFIAAVSISGVPPFNGFFSKELIYEAAKTRGLIFYVAALAGSFFTAASFLKLGHAAFIGKLKEEHKNVKEAPLFMLVPMMLIAFTCVLFGIFSHFPLSKLIQPVLGANLREGHSFTVNPWLTIITLLVLAGAIIHHLAAVKIQGGGLKAAEHIHHAPVFSTIYDLAQKKFFDPYEIGLKLVNACSRVLFRFDRFIDWLYEGLIGRSGYLFAVFLKSMHTGNYVSYIAWSLLGSLLVVASLAK